MELNAAAGIDRGGGFEWYRPDNTPGIFQRRRQVRGDVIRPEHWDQLMGDLERNRATYIIDGARAFRNWKAFPIENYPRMIAFLDAHYELFTTVGAVRIFKRRGCEAEAKAER